MSELLEKILDDDNVKIAMQRVKSNGGTFGVDKMELSKLDDYMEEHLEEIKHEIRTRTFVPNPVKRVEIPKPNGGVRKLGIPTVVDRTIQQAIVDMYLLSQVKAFISTSYSGFSMSCHSLNSMPFLYRINITKTKVVL